MAQRFQNKTAMIIGGATGIGAATAERLAQEGAKVVIADHAKDAAEETAGRIKTSGGAAIAIACDVADEDQVRKVFDAAQSAFKGLDAVHINVADTSIAARDSDVTTVPLEVFDRALTVNLRGHMLATRYAVPLLLKQGGGAIVYTSSRAGLTSEPVRVSYATSKSGIHALMRHVALTWGKQGLRANVVAPGTILTPPLRALGEDFMKERLSLTRAPRLGEPEDVATAVAFLLSDEAAFINGQILSVDGGVTMR